jgi:TonB family protein
MRKSIFLASVVAVLAGSGVAISSNAFGEVNGDVVLKMTDGAGPNAQIIVRYLWRSADSFVVKTPDGKRSRCQPYNGLATEAAPTPVHLTVCSADKKWSRITLVNDLTGTVMKEWVAAPKSNDLPKASLIRFEPQEIFAKYYPERAMRMNVRGRVTVTCHLNGVGRLQDCIALNEIPSDWGFGESALKMSKRWKAEEQPPGQNLSEQDVTFTLDFKPSE